MWRSCRRRAAPGLGSGAILDARAAAAVHYGTAEIDLETGVIGRVVGGLTVEAERRQDGQIAVKAALPASKA
jgi:hypothetical protein